MKDCAAASAKICKTCLGDRGDFQLDKTKVFIKGDQDVLLDQRLGQKDLVITEVHSWMGTEKEVQQATAERFYYSDSLESIFPKAQIQVYIILK